MPKVPKNYQDTVIYKIVCNDLNIEDVYVGHTTNFTKRKCQHKSATNYENGTKYNLKIYKTIRDNGGFENWSMIEIEKYPCNDLQEAINRERYYYELLNAKLNTVIPARNIQEYYKDNKELALECPLMGACARGERTEKVTTTVSAVVYILLLYYVYLG